MQLCVLALAAALVGMICVPTSFAQNQYLRIASATLA